MSESSTSYVNQTPEGGWRVAGSRVSLDSIVHAYWQGRMAESIAADFPSLSLEQVYGAITFYLHRRQEIDAYLAEQVERWQQFSSESIARHGGLVDRIRASARSPVRPGTDG